MQIEHSIVLITKSQKNNRWMKKENFCEFYQERLLIRANKANDIKNDAI